MKRYIMHLLKYQLCSLKEEKLVSGSFTHVGIRASLSLINHFLKQSPLSSNLNPCRNQNGLTHISLVLSVLIISFGYLLTLKALNENLRIKEKANLLLCQKEFEFSKRSYIKRMSQFNIAIKAAFNLRFIPVTAPYALKIQEGAKKFQQLYHISKIKSPLSFKHCSSQVRITYFKNLPYKTRKKLFLTRRFDGTVPVRKEIWNEVIWSKQKNIFIKSQFTLKGRFQGTPTVNRKFYLKEVLQNWRQPYGSYYL